MSKPEFKLGGLSFYNLLLKTFAVVILLGVVVFSYLKFELNPVLFSIAISLSFFMLYFVLSNSSLEIHSCSLKINHNGFGDLFNSSKKVHFEDIKSVYYQQRSYNQFNLIKNVPGTNKSPEIHLTLHSNKSIIIQQIGTESEFENAFKLLSDKIALTK